MNRASLSCTSYSTVLRLATRCGQDCEPLSLMAADGTAFAFLGVPELLKRSIAPETALQPAHAAGAAGLIMQSGLLCMSTSHQSMPPGGTAGHSCSLLQCVNSNWELSAARMEWNPIQSSEMSAAQIQPGRIYTSEGW